MDFANVNQVGFQRPMNHPTMYGMPVFINIFGSQDQSQGFEGFDNNDIFGFMPRFRPFPF